MGWFVVELGASPLKLRLVQRVWFSSWRIRKEDEGGGWASLRVELEGSGDLVAVSRAVSLTMRRGGAWLVQSHPTP